MTNGTGKPSDRSTMTIELARLLADFVQAVDAGAVQLASADIDLGNGQQPHPWHEEWLYSVRRALEPPTH